MSLKLGKLLHRRRTLSLCKNKEATTSRFWSITLRPRSFLLFLISALGIADLAFRDMAAGYVGFGASYLFLKLFDFWAALIILLALDIVGLFIMMNFHIPGLFKKDEAEAEDDEPAERQRPVPVVREELTPIAVYNPVVKEPEAKPAPADEFGVLSLKTKRSKGLREMFGLLPPLELLEDDRGTPS